MALTNNGYEVPTQTEILNNIEDGQKKIFPNIILDASSPDSQLNNLMAEAVITAYEVSSGIYNGLDPRVADGVMLDRVCALTGVVRKEATYSKVIVTFTGNNEAIVPAGTELSASSIPDSKYIIEDAITIVDGTGDAVARFYQVGDTDIPLHAIDTITVPLSGISAVVNNYVGVNGGLRENDEELRIRRDLSLELNSTGLVNSVYSGILDIDEVTQARVFENYTDSTDANGITAHSIMAVVIGGSDEDVGAAIMENKSLGCGLDGATTTSWIDQNGYSHTVKFQRPEEVDVYIKVKLDTVTTGIAADVKENLLAYIANLQATSRSDCMTASLGIGDDVYASIFYAPISGDEDFNVLDITIGTAASPTGNTVAIGNLKISAFETANIEVTT